MEQQHHQALHLVHLQQPGVQLPVEQLRARGRELPVELIELLAVLCGEGLPDGRPHRGAQVQPAVRCVRWVDGHLDERARGGGLAALLAELRLRAVAHGEGALDEDG